MTHTSGQTLNIVNTKQNIVCLFVCCLFVCCLFVVCLLFVVGLLFVCLFVFY